MISYTPPQQPPQPQQERVCLGCGMKIPISGVVCPYCGKQVFGAKKKVNGRSSAEYSV